MKSGVLLAICLLLLFIGCVTESELKKNSKPTVYMIGDSTVKNGRGDGNNGQWGWGSFLWQYFDTTAVSFDNHAIGGRSSRTFISEGRWARVLELLKPGDYVFIQFGHNDAGPLNTGRARASLQGNHDTDTVVVMESTGLTDTIHSFGWYMRKYIREAKEKKAIPVVFSHIPRNNFVTLDSTEIVRNTTGFGQWSKEAAEMEGGIYIDLNERIATEYESMGKELIQLMFHGDHTHTSYAGAQLNARIVAELLEEQKQLPLSDWSLIRSRKK